MRAKRLFEITHNCRVKVFPDGSQEVLIAEYPIFRDPGYERVDDWEKHPREDGKPGDPATNLARAKRRARSAVRDLALANDFSYFVTLTLDQQKVDRYDAAAVTRKLNQWLDNQVRRKGLRYVLVAERHQDGAIHFHGFFNDALQVVDSGTVSLPGGGKPRRPRSAAQRAAWLASGGHVVYNLPGWSLGFTTAIALYGERRAAVGYVCKYISKAQEKVGGRWYYSGGDLRRPEVVLSDVDFEELSAAKIGTEFTIDGLGCRVISLAGGDSDGLRQDC